MIQRLLLLAAILTPGLFTPSLLHAQALPTGSRSLGISVFAGAGKLYTDYGDNQTGYLLGADFTRHFHLLDPSLELRATLSPKGNAVGQDTYTAGLKLAHRFRNLNPYATLLVGIGDIYFTHPNPFIVPAYTQDNSFIYTGGAGLDYDLPRNFGLKADFSYQSWHLGSNQNRLTPSLLSGGVYYRIPFTGFHRGR